MSCKSGPSSAFSSNTLPYLLSIDAAERSAAEKQLQETNILDRIAVFVQALTAIANHKDDGTAVTENNGALLHMVAVLLRRDILKLDGLNDSGFLQNLVSPMLHAFTGVEALTKTAVGHCLAEICSVLETTSYSSDAQHHGRISDIVISQILASIAPSASEGNLESLQLLVSLSERAPKSFVQVALPSLPQLIQSLVKHPVFHTELEEGMEHSYPNKGRLYVVATELVTTTALAGAVIGDAEDSAESSDSAAILDNTQRPASQLTIPAFLPLLSLHNVFSDLDTVAKVLPFWMQAAHLAPGLFVGESDHTVWERTVVLCLQISSQDQDSKLAIQAMHVLSYLVSHLKTRLSDSMRQNLMQSVIPRLMNILHSEVDADVDGWASEPVTSSVVDKDTFGDDDGEARYAYEQLQAWICTAPAMAMSIALPLLERHLDKDWSSQWAAIVCIQACAEEAPVTFATFIPSALQASLHLATVSRNARVQYQSIQLTGVLCETGNAIVWDMFGERILQVLTSVLGSPSDRVRTMACTTLAAYCRPQDDNRKLDAERFLIPYLRELLVALVQAPLSGPTAVQSRAVQAVLCLAHVSGPAFVPYYSQVMPGLLALAQQAKSNQYEDVKLQTTAIEAATILGQSLGEENSHIFSQDATLIMQWIIPLLQQQGQGGTNSCIHMGQLLSACSRIASVAGEAYSEYAQLVVSHLIQRVQSATDIEITEGDLANLEASKPHDIDLNEETGDESLTVVVPGRGLTKLTINTTQLEEKAEAIRGIYEHAVGLDDLFAPYAISCFDVLIPLIKFRYAADVRATSAQSLAAVYEAACSHGDKTGDFSLCSNYLPKLILELAQHLPEENEMDALHALADAISEILCSTYVRRVEYGHLLMRSLSLHDAEALVRLCLRSALVPCLERRAKVTNTLRDPGSLSGEDEKASYQEILQREKKLLTPIVDSVGYTLKLFGESFYPIFKEYVVPILGPYLTEGHDVRARLAAVCLFDDCVEFCGPDVPIEVGPRLVQGIMLGLNEASIAEDDELAQAAVYGIIQLARSDSAGQLVPHAQVIVHTISTILQGNKEEAASLPLFENCVSAIASLFLLEKAPFRSSGLLKMGVATSLFLKNLPLNEDYDQAKICHAGLCDLIRTGQIDLQHECGPVIRVAGEILALVQEEEPVATQETCEELAKTVFDLQHTAKPPFFDSAYAALPETSKSALQVALQDFVYASHKVVTP